ncbi:MAG TPA: GAF domain-containing sensor histidine kinase [Candidatus Limnocylindrales bacterium]|nr:GAF domain-containing sensor histidine kinase [Candidatus Limnocylindrales bacterium]
MRSDDALYALDAATRAIAGELDLDRVLQLMVDGVRELIGSDYAALGIVDQSGRIERFITSGLTGEQRTAIGPLPSGHGLLGTIIRDGVSLRIADIAQHHDTYGFPPNHPPMRTLLGVPVRIAGEPIGNFYLTEKLGGAEFDADDQELVEMFAVHAGIAIQNARLHQQVKDLAVVDERLRISQDLHDGIIQSIYAVALSLEDVPDLMTENRAEATDRVDRAIDRLNVTIGDIRAFITGLEAPTDTTLKAALEAVVLEIARDPSLAVEVDLAGADAVDGRLSGAATHALLQIAREALSNTVRHSRATHARVSFEVAGQAAQLVVSDDGRGFDTARRRDPGHFGIANLRDRAAAAGGTIEIESEAEKGTRIIVRLPLLEPETSPR